MKEGYIETELGVLPDSWEIVKQEDVATFYNGRAFKLSEWEETGTAVIRLQNLTGSGKEFYYSNLQLPEQQYCNKGDLLYMWSATFGPVWWKGSKAIYHYHIWKIEVDKKRLNKIYHYYLLDEVTLRMKNQSHGSTMLHVTKGGMEKLKIALPPLIEQEKIAEILSTVDDKIDVIQEQIRQATELKKGLMQQLLTKGIGHTEFKNSPLGEIPASWEIKKLGDLVSKVGSGITPKGGHESYLKSGIIFIRSQNVLRGNLNLNDVAYISSEQHEKMSNSKLLAGDVLLNITGASIGRSCIVPNEIVEANVNQHVCIIRPTQHLNSTFLSQLLNSSYGALQIDKFQAGGNREGLNFQQIRSFTVPCPPIDEQINIASLLKNVDSKINILIEKKSTYMDFKKSLMQQLLTGKIRVNSLIEEETFA
jgi:type I restriction enzyme, S subunit